ncbi:MAG: PEP/pyruvate-binding domain-containing protein, partial [Acidimicrobiales bacterium]
MADHIVWFDSYDEVVHRCRVGGKNASLGIMMAAGLPVPPGFALTTEAYDAVRAHPDVAGELEAIVGSLDFADAGGLRAASGRIRSLLHSVPMAAGVESALRDAYAALSDRCGLADVPVAVRSSATAEDLPDASFAGQQDTFLWVVGADALTDKVKLCWSSLFTDRALAYRHQMGY